jgi:hypothetical protein
MGDNQNPRLVFIGQMGHIGGIWVVREIGRIRV